MKFPLIIVIRGGQFEKRLVNAAANQALKTGAEILLEREPKNAHDFNAIKAAVRKPDEDAPEVFEDFPLGYVAREVAFVLAPMMDTGSTFKVKLLTWSASSVNAEISEEKKDGQD